MGRAGRWLRGLLGGKKPAPTVPAAEPKATKEKKRWGFGKSFREKKGVTSVVMEERKGSSSYREMEEDDNGDEQNKRAIAVAAATAAVAEAAVAAAHAAAAVVRLTSSGRSVGYGRRELLAAVKIQAAFRGYLARRALRALKGLVKLQALVRGNIVRKQAAETLRCMHALVRVQARARACRALRSDKNHSLPGPSTPEKYEQSVGPSAPKSHRGSPLKRNSSKPISISDGLQNDRGQSPGWNWLNRWMEERYWDSRESARSAVAVSTPTDDEKNAKILEIDTGKPHYNQKRKCNHLQSVCSPLTSDQNSRSFTTLPDSPSKDSTVVQRSIPSPSSVDMQQSISPIRFPIIDTAEYAESPQFFSASSRPGSSRKGPFTPTKSECSRSLFSGYSDYPNYMANTESSKAKVRSQSAPKQRPDFEKSGSVRKVSAHPFAQQLAQRSSSLHAKFANKAYPGSGRLDRLGMPIRI